LRVDPFDLSDAVIVTSTDLIDDAQGRLCHEVLILEFHLRGCEILLDRRKVLEQSCPFGGNIDTSGEIGSPLIAIRSVMLSRWGLVNLPVR